MEIIKRKIDSIHNKIGLTDNYKVQFSINDYGHLCIRFFNDISIDEEESKKRTSRDVLVVLTTRETSILRRFLKILGND